MESRRLVVVASAVAAFLVVGCTSRSVLVAYRPPQSYRSLQVLNAVRPGLAHAPRRAARRYLVAVQPARGLDPRGKNPVGNRSEFGAAGWRGIRGRVRLRAPSPSMIIAGDRHGHRMDSQRRSLVTQALLAERR